MTRTRCSWARHAAADALGRDLLGAAFQLVFTMEVFLLTKNLLTLCYACRSTVCARCSARVIPAIFDLVLLWGRTRLPALLGNLRFWKASSYSPLALDLPDATAGDAAAPVRSFIRRHRRAIRACTA